MSFLDRFNLGHGYRKYFCIHAASTEALRDEVFRIRHEVYCEDLGFEAVRADGRERDDYDDQSVHCLLRSRNDPPAPVGCARLVLTREGDRDQPLPFERTCAASIDRSIIDPARLPRERIAEVSRLAVRAAYRRRKTDVDHRLIHDEDFRSDAQPRFPYIPISLYLGAGGARRTPRHRHPVRAHRTAARRPFRAPRGRNSSDRRTGGTSRHAHPVDDGRARDHRGHAHPAQADLACSPRGHRARRRRLTHARCAPPQAPTSSAKKTGGRHPPVIQSSHRPPQLLQAPGRG
jgi:N-acyl amino acid synthase of PEP-CTERM/exosortase system